MQRGRKVLTPSTNTAVFSPKSNSVISKAMDNKMKKIKLNNEKMLKI